MRKLATDVTIKADGTIPIELVKSAVEMKDVLLNNLPFLITIAIIVAAATVTYMSNRRSVATQNDIAKKARNEEHENKISEFRHQWIQEVRETVSLLCQILHELQYNIVQRNVATTNVNAAIRKKDDESAAKFEADATQYFNNLLEKRSEFYKLSTKLKLLFKKDEPTTTKAFKIIDDMNNKVYDFDNTDLEETKIDSIVSSFQEVLKTEWEVTKERSWQKNT